MVYFALGDAGLFYIAPYRGAPIGDLIMSVMILAPPVIIFIIMAFYFRGHTTKIEKSVEAILEVENSKYIGSSSQGEHHSPSNYGELAHLISGT